MNSRQQDATFLRQTLSALPVAVIAGAVSLGAAVPMANAAWPEDWRATRELRNDVPDPNATFGDSVAIDGNYAVVGHPDDNRFSNNRSGAVLIYDAVTGAHLRTLVAPRQQGLARFGHAVAVSGERVLIGSPYASEFAKDSGIAYLFDVVSGDLVGELPIFNNEDPLFEERWDWRIGYDVAIEGDIAAVAAPGGPNGIDFDTGAVFVFDVATGVSLSLIAPAHPASRGTGFATSIDFDGPLLITGAPFDNWSGDYTGAAYVHRTLTGDEVSILRLESSLQGDQFGSEVAIAGRLAAVGAFSQSGGGAVHIFDALTAAPLTSLRSDDPDHASNFGYAIAASDNRLMVGAFHDRTRGRSAGAAFFFDFGSGELISKVTGLDTDADDRFGESVAISTYRAIAGAPGAQNSPSDRGSAYIIDRIATRPLLRQEGRCGGEVTILIENLTPGGRGALFAGTHVAQFELPGPSCPGLVIDLAPPWVAGSPFIVDADDEGRASLVASTPSNACGFLHVQAVNLSTCGLSELLEISDDPWRLETIFRPGDEDMTIDLRAVATNGIHTLSPGTYRPTGGRSEDAVHVYDAATGAYLSTLAPEVYQAAARFGIALAIDGNVAVVGASQDDDLAVDAGAIYTFDLATGEQLLKLTAPDGGPEEYFGTAVRSLNGLLAVGAPDHRMPPDPPAASGAVYLFDLVTGEPLRKMLHPRLQGNARFGSTLDLDGGLVVAGAPNDGLRGGFGGAAYVFDAETGALLHTLIGSDTVYSDRFALALDADNGIAIVGAPTADRHATRREEGRAYLFDLTTGEELFLLQPLRPKDYEHFGHSVAISGPNAVVSVPGSDVAFDDGGAIDVFSVISGSRIMRFVPSTCATDARFAEALSMHGDTIFATSVRSNDPTVYHAGLVHLIREVPLIP